MENGAPEVVDLSGLVNEDRDRANQGLAVEGEELGNVVAGPASRGPGLPELVCSRTSLLEGLEERNRGDLFLERRGGDRDSPASRSGASAGW